MNVDRFVPPGMTCEALVDTDDARPPCDHLATAIVKDLFDTDRYVCTQHRQYLFPLKERSPHVQN